MCVGVGVHVWLLNEIDYVGWECVRVCLCNTVCVYIKEKRKIL
jgi:hypothetical protein